MKRVIYQSFFYLLFAVTVLISADKVAGSADQSRMNVLLLNFVNSTGDRNYSWIEGSLPKAIYESIMEELRKTDPGLTSFSFIYDKINTLAPGSGFDAYSAAAGKTGSDIIITGAYKLNKKNKKISIHIELYRLSKSTVSGKFDTDSPVDSTMFITTDRISAEILAHVRRLKTEDTGNGEKIAAVKENGVETSGTLTKSGDGSLCLEGDCINGFGRMRFPGGEEYAGEFKDGYICKKGFMAWPNGDRYEGVYDSGARNGYGVFWYRNGDLYSGSYRNNLKDGYGVYKWENGETYSGEWKNGRMHGNGTLEWPDGTKYTGSFSENRMDGKGVMTWKSGVRYEGEMKNGRINGDGIMTYSDGTTVNGSWKDGQYVGDK